MRSQPPFVFADFLDACVGFVLTHPFAIGCLLLVLVIGIFLRLTWDDDQRIAQEMARRKREQDLERARLDAITRLAEYRARPDYDRQIHKAVRRGRGDAA